MVATNEIVLKKPTISNVSLSNTDWTAITISDTSLKAIIIQCRTSVDLLISFDKLQSTYWTIKSGGSISIDSSFSNNTDTAENLIFWIKTNSPTVIVEVVMGE